MESMTFTLTPVPPYDWTANLAYVRTSAAAVLEQTAGVTFVRAWRIDGLDVVLRAQPATPAEGHAVSATPSHTTPGTRVAANRAPSVHIHATPLRVEVFGATLTPQLAEAAADRFRRQFQLDADPSGFLRTCAADPALAPILAHTPGLRPVLFGDPYEALLWAIIGQQIHTKVAKKLKLALLERFGHAVESPAGTHRVLPEPAELAAISPEVLRTLGMSRTKAEAIVAVSEAVVMGRLDLASLRHLPVDEAMRQLTAFRGIGRWTAEYVLMRGLGFPDVIPAADVGIQQALAAALGRDTRLTEAEVRTRADAWHPWRSWAAYLLWYSLQITQAATVPEKG